MTDDNRKPTVTRRTLLGGLATTSTVALAGCTSSRRATITDGEDVFEAEYDTVSLFTSEHGVVLRLTRSFEPRVNYLVCVQEGEQQSHGRLGVGEQQTTLLVPEEKSVVLAVQIGEVEDDTVVGGTVAARGTLGVDT
jgi:hypothetical protein